MVKKTNALMLFVSLLALLITLSGCAGPIYVKGGLLRTPESKIEAEDGSFVIRTGEQFTTPSYVQNVSLLLALWNGKTSDIKSLYGKALENGAKKVTVTIPYRTEPLFGVLAFAPLPSRASGPGARSFEISIPESYVKAALGGRISVVYELVNDKYVNWALWLSDQPFNP